MIRCIAMPVSCAPAAAAFDLLMLRRILALLRRRRPLANGGQAMPAGIVPAVQVGAPILPGEAFTPTHPRTARGGLIGREQEVQAIVQRLTEDKAHIVLYSERGIGKTSLANSVIEQLRRAGVFVARYQCEASSTFDSLMRGLVRTLPAALLTGPIRSGLFEGCEAAFPATPIRPDDVVALLGRLRLDFLICVIDEVDRIADAGTRTLLADTIKQLSDRGVPLLFMLIGVSDSLEQLLGEHPSIQRALVGVPLKLLSDADIAAIIERGAKAAGLTFPPELVQDVARMARGMPYIAHLLGLRTAQAAARRSTRDVTGRDFLAAVEQLIIETPSQVVQLFDDLTALGQDSAMCLALNTVTGCEQDGWGRIRIVDGPAEELLVGGRPMARSRYLALRDAGIVRPCDGAAGYVIIAHRGRGVILYHAFRQVVQQIGTRRSGDDDSAAGSPIAPANDCTSDAARAAEVSSRQSSRP